VAANVRQRGFRLPAGIRGHVLIKAVFFDYDGVLTTDKTGSLTTTRHLSKATGIELSIVKATFGRYNRDLTLGKTTHGQVWREICSALGQEVDIRLLFEAFESTPMNTGMFSLARDLKKTHLVGIITDNKKDRIDHLKRLQQLESIFSPIVVSAEVGVDKKSDQIFMHALELADINAEEALFIDNSKDNLVAPRALGIKTVFHDDEKNDIEALSKTLMTFGLLARDA
jgi:putative hydrolase of the HAD superfamily